MHEEESTSDDIEELTYGMVNAEDKKKFDKFTHYFFAINVSILMYKKPPEIQYNTSSCK